MRKYSGLFSVLPRLMWDKFHNFIIEIRKLKNIESWMQQMNAVWNDEILKMMCKIDENFKHKMTNAFKREYWLLNWWENVTKFPLLRKKKLLNLENALASAWFKWKSNLLLSRSQGQSKILFSNQSINFFFTVSHFPPNHFTKKLNINIIGNYIIRIRLLILCNVNFFQLHFHFFGVQIGKFCNCFTITEINFITKLKVDFSDLKTFSTFSYQCMYLIRISC